MKKTLLFIISSITLCIPGAIHGIKKPKKETVARVLVGTLLATAALSNTGALIESVHTQENTTAFPWNDTLPNSTRINSMRCTFSYGNPCFSLPDPDGGVVRNDETCCLGAENTQECNELCRDRQQSPQFDGNCVILRTCTGETTYDPQFGWNIASLASVFGLVVERCFIWRQ